MKKDNSPTSQDELLQSDPPEKKTKLQLKRKTIRVLHVTTEIRAGVSGPSGTSG